MIKIKKYLTTYFVQITSVILIVLGIQPTSASAAGANGLSDLVNKSFSDAATAAGLKTADSDKLSVIDLFGLYVQVALGFIGVLFLVQVVHGGILWMSAGGNEEQITHARKKILNAGLGAAIVFACFIFVSFVMSQVAGSIGVQY